MSFGFGFWLNRLFAYMGGKLLTVQSLTHTHSNGDIFHDSEKMAKHVEMVRTKCQPKIGTDKMPTTEKSPDEMPTTEKSGQNANLWLAFRPVGILSGWHFVLPPTRMGCQAFTLRG